MDKYEKPILKIVKTESAITDKVQAQPKSTYDCMMSQ